MPLASLGGSLLFKGFDVAPSARGNVPSGKGGGL
jgi:hypothetical protein